MVVPADARGNPFSTMHLPFAPKSRGIALMAAVVTLVILGLIMSAIAWQIVAGGRILAHRSHELQAMWLSRAGIEYAVARILEEPDNYRGETIKPIEQAIVVITVAAEQTPDTYNVTCESRYPIDRVNVVVRRESRSFRRVLDGETIRMEGIMSSE